MIDWEGGLLGSLSEALLEHVGGSMICEPKPETSALHLREQKHCNKSCERPLYLLTGLHSAPAVFRLWREPR